MDQTKFYLSMHSALFGEAFNELGLGSGTLAFCHHENVLGVADGT